MQKQQTIAYDDSSFPFLFHLTSFVLSCPPFSRFLISTPFLTSSVQPSSPLSPFLLTSLLTSPLISFPTLSCPLFSSPPSPFSSFGSPLCSSINLYLVLISFFLYLPPPFSFCPLASFLLTSFILSSLLISSPLTLEEEDLTDRPSPQPPVL